MLACHHLSQKSPQAITRLVFHRETHLGQFLLHLVVHIHVPLLRLDGDEVVAFPEVAAHLVRGMGVNGGLVLGHDALDQIVGMGTDKARLGDGFAHFGGELEAKAALMVLKPALGTGAAGDAVAEHDGTDGGGGGFPEEVFMTNAVRHLPATAGQRFAHGVLGNGGVLVVAAPQGVLTGVAEVWRPRTRNRSAARQTAASG